MKQKLGFFDLRISGQQSLNNLNNTFEKLIKLGYRMLAVDTVIPETAFDTTGSKKGKSKQPGEKCIVPSPPEIHGLSRAFKDKLTILHRLTVHFSDAEQLSRLHKEQHISKYELLAVVPSSELAFQVACAHPKVDIISFDDSNPLSRVTRKHYYMAVERGICFEISYARAILDREIRRNIIVLAHMYHMIGKSRNIVLTSGASCPSELRGPYDVINLGLLFGMSEEQSKAALTYTCRKLLIDAEARRAGRAVALVKRSDLQRFDLPIKDEGAPSKRVKTEAE